MFILLCVIIQKLVIIFLFVMWFMQYGVGLQPLMGFIFNFLIVVQYLIYVMLMLKFHLKGKIVC